MMLRRFSVTNYRGFGRKLELDLTRRGDYGISGSCVSDQGISKSMVYGVNGIGKTNLGYAITDIVYTLTDSVPSQYQIDESTFLNGHDDLGYAEFEYEFGLGDHIVVYSYRKESPYRIIRESLMVDGVPIMFSDSCPEGNGHRGLKTCMSRLRSMMDDPCRNGYHVLDDLRDFVGHMVYFGPVARGTVTDCPDSMGWMDDFIVSMDLVSDFQDFLHGMTGEDIRLEEREGIIHQLFDRASLPFPSVRSSGTSELERLYCLIRGFGDASFLYLDGFDGSCHFDLARRMARCVLEAFADSQVMMVGYNTALIGTDMMRPDCYLVLSEGGLASFDESTDRELCEGHNLERMYRAGAFDNHVG